jgi:hypothetical protein
MFHLIFRQTLFERFLSLEQCTNMLWILNATIPYDDQDV